MKFGNIKFYLNDLRDRMGLWLMVSAWFINKKS